MSDFSIYLPADPNAPPWGLRVLAGGIGTVAPGQEYPLSIHPRRLRQHWEQGRVLDEWQLILIADGAGDVRTQRGQRRVTAGDMFVLVPGRWHWFQPDVASGWQERWIALSGPLCRALPSVLDPELTLRPDSPARIALDDVLDLIFRRTPGFADEAATAAARLLARLNTLTRFAADLDPLQAAVDRLLTADAAAIDLAALADQAGLSPSQFRRRFIHLTGLPPKVFHAQALASRARRLLAEPGRRLDEVADTLGFSDYAYFNRWFAQIAGEPPGRWRQSHKRHARPPTA